MNWRPCDRTVVTDPIGVLTDPIGVLMGPIGSPISNTATVDSPPHQSVDVARIRAHWGWADLGDECAGDRSISGSHGRP